MTPLRPNCCSLRAKPSGVLSVWTAPGSWVAPPHWAVWAPAGVAHAMRFTGASFIRTLYVRPGEQSAAPLEATTQDKFQLLGGRIVFEFDAAKKQMIQKRGGPERVFTKEK